MLASPCLHHLCHVCTQIQLPCLQTAQELQRELASKSCELSAVNLDLHRWKGKAALQQLRLASADEDLGHHRVHISALSAECSRRQHQCNALQNELQTAQASQEDLRAQLAHQNAVNADIEVCAEDTKLNPSAGQCRMSLHGILQHSCSARYVDQGYCHMPLATDAARSNMLDLQGQRQALKQTLQGKEDLLRGLQAELQRLQSSLTAAEQAAATAEKQHAAFEERARLAEQVYCAAVDMV